MKKPDIFAFWDLLLLVQQIGVKIGGLELKAPKLAQ